MYGCSFLSLAVDSIDVLLHVNSVYSESVLYGLLSCELMVLTVRKLGIGSGTGSSCDQRWLELVLSVLEWGYCRVV